MSSLLLSVHMFLHLLGLLKVLRLVLWVFVFLSSWHFLFREFDVLDNFFFQVDGLLFDTCIGFFIDSLVEFAFSLILYALFTVHDIFWQVTMVMNTSYLASMNIFFNQFLPIFNGSVFPLIDNTSWFIRNAFPNSDVHIFRT